MDQQRIQDLKRFYVAIARLQAMNGGARTLAGSTGRHSWPRRGVYFFMEDGEARSDTGDGPRIVRVGTHALKAESGTRLWTRLSQHRGQSKSGGGNHRGSVFRLIVGTSLIARDGHVCRTWGMGNTANSEIRAGEIALEQAVSRVIGAMPFVWIAIDDEPGADSQRGYIERNAIALLSNFGKEPLDAPSPGWLGHFCEGGRIRSSGERIRKSGLWNSNHVDEEYDPEFLGRLEQHITAMEQAS
ncbi:hypothetical protein GCM10007874_50640 [Labrys miyagiensis]|uniref:GIY-YIG domain-containing protein n=1 Tax=Labrys miyagiensis TaxID=346912 RepID=A0ABQ6CUW5_9HYPH|nr:hypothetical protein [Labrys miyagiensis]GLS22047.1 hypothetical protein GCM10007874_50640 [Labrys miyagiensis]